MSHLIVGVDHLARKSDFDQEKTAVFLMALGVASMGGWGAGVLASQVLSGDLPLGTVTAMPGILTAVACLVLVSRFWQFSLSRYLDLVAPIWCFAHVWGRLGCFLAGCCFGVPTTGPFGLVFPEGSFAQEAHGPVGVHPTQLYEMAALMALGLLLTYRVKAGWRVCTYMIGYGACRFVIEMFRGDTRGELALIPGLSPSQQTSLLFISGGVMLYLWTRWKSERVIEHSRA